MLLRLQHNRTGSLSSRLSLSLSKLNAGELQIEFNLLAAASHINGFLKDGANKLLGKLWLVNAGCVANKARVKGL